MADEPNRPVLKEVSPGMRLFRPDSPVVALGLAVNHLMSKKAFALLRFGECCKILVGQINRKHYWFVVDGGDQVVGFLGWAITYSDVAEAWLERNQGFSDAEAREGDCILFNAWSASTSEVNPFLLHAARQAATGREMAYFRRLYMDGSVRPVRLRVNDFVGGHLARRGGDDCS
jgi:hemolysin-activating ACP:hemolysin acyltransferase